MAVEIRDFRLSFVWFETNLALLESMEGNAPYSFLGRSSTYSSKFDQANRPDAQELQAPWPKPSGQRFWTFYLRMTPGSVGGADAWRALVPLRATPPFELTAPWLQGKVSSELCYYPHGLAWIVSARCAEALSLEKAVDVAFRLRNGAKLDVQWKEGPASLSLDAIAQAALPRIRATALGKAAAAGAVTLTPLSVFTVVSGDGVDPNEAVPEEHEIHRSLEAVTAWRPTWQADKLPALDDARVGIRKSAPKSHLVYGSKRGRAVWFPELFLSTGAGVQSLSCYHRNLTLLSMQVESLSGLLAEVDRRITAGNVLQQGVVQCAKQAARLLETLYTGTDATYGEAATYRSGSARAQLDRNDLVPMINRVRDYFGIAPPLEAS
jgi:hypothetical protein